MFFNIIGKSHGTTQKKREKIYIKLLIFPTVSLLAHLGGIPMPEIPIFLIACSAIELGRRLFCER